MLERVTVFLRQIVVSLNIWVAEPAFDGPSSMSRREIVVVVCADERPSVTRDILHVLASLSLEDFLGFLRNIVVEDLWETVVQRKFKLLAGFIRNIPRFLGDFLRDPIGCIRKLWRNLSARVWKSIETMCERWNEMAGAERFSLVTAILVHLLIAGAGAYMGNGIPDLDISLMGIGKHRNFFTHSVLPALGVEFSALVLHRLIDGFKDRLPPNAHPIWENLRHAKTGLNAAVVGVYAGLSWHLFKDLFIDGSQAIRGPGFNTFVSGTYLDDNAYLAGNLGHGLWETIMSLGSRTEKP